MTTVVMAPDAMQSFMREPTMIAYSHSHLSDQALLKKLATVVAQDRATTAELVACIAEVEARRLYAPAGYPSMQLYCIHELHLSEDAAYKRVYAARLARRFPAIFTDLAEGRLHLSGLLMLKPWLTEATVGELLEAARHKTKSEIEMLLAEWFPRADVPTRLERVVDNSVPEPSNQTAPEQADNPRPADVGGSSVPELSSQTASQQTDDPLPTNGGDKSVPEPSQGSPDGIEMPAGLGGTITSGPRPRVTPLAPQRFALQVTIGQSTHDKLRHAQNLLGHQVRSGDVAEVLDRALDALIQRLEKRKFAATEKPRPIRKTPAPGERHVPAYVQRAVWSRDGGQCTFVAEDGRRCAERSGLEFDHIDEVARGGKATIDRIRLRCRAHNQYEAERTFGAEFMKGKRQRAMEARARADVESPHVPDDLPALAGSLRRPTGAHPAESGGRVSAGEPAP